MELAPRWLTSLWNWVKTDIKVAALVAYLGLSALGFVGSTIFYAQLGIWYPHVAGVADYFLAALQNFLALIFIPLMIIASLIYYLLGRSLEASMQKFDAIIKRAETKAQSTNKLVRSYLWLYEHTFGPFLRNTIRAYKGSFLVLVPGSIIITFAILPYLNGQEIADGGDGNFINPASSDVAINGEIVTFLDSTSSFVILLDHRSRTIIVLPKSEIKSMRVSVQ